MVTSLNRIPGVINCNLYDTSQELSGVVNQFLHDTGLISSHELDETFDPSNSYTRCCEKSGTYSLLDFIFFSKSLRARVKNCSILYDGANPSDHFPVQMDLEVFPTVTA